MLKKRLNADERLGLTDEEIKLAEKWLRKHKTAGALHDGEALKLFELFMIGTSFMDMHLQYPQHPMGQILLTAALRQWCRDREKLMSSLQDRVKAKIVKAVVESVDFLTSTLSVAGTEHLNQMRQYVADPVNNPAPKLRIGTLKEYKDVLETLQKLVSSTAPTNGKGGGSAMIGALEKSRTTIKEIASPVKEDSASLLAIEVGEDGETDD